MSLFLSVSYMLIVLFESGECHATFFVTWYHSDNFLEFLGIYPPNKTIFTTYQHVEV